MPSDPISDVVLRGWEGAEEVLRSSWKEWAAPVEPAVIAERLGIQVDLSPLPEGLTGTLTGSAAAATIHVDGSLPVRKVRRALAHQLGHWRDFTERGVPEMRVVEGPAGEPPVAEDELYADAFDLALRLPWRLLEHWRHAGWSGPEIVRALDVPVMDILYQGRIEKRATTARLFRPSPAKPPSEWW